MEELFSISNWRIVRESAPLPDGRMKNIVRLHTADTVHILPILSPEKIVIIREFRPFYADYIWLLPSGKADLESDLTAAAQRELREETGYRAESMQPYCSCNYVERMAFTNHIFIAKGLTKDPLPMDSFECIETHEKPFSEALELILGSPRVHAASAYGLLRYMHEFPAG